MSERVKIVEENPAITMRLGSGADSWKNYWLKNAANQFGAAECRNTHCSNDALSRSVSISGVHIQKAGGIDEKRYVTILCKKCSAMSKGVVISVKEPLVPVEL